MRRLAVVLVASIAAFAAAPTAFAATVEKSGNAIVYDVDIQNIFAQDLLVTFKDNRYSFEERGPEPRLALNPNAGCRKEDDVKVMTCDGTGVERLVIETENLGDVVEIGDGVNVRVSFSLGQGSDQANGSPQGDRYVGGPLAGLGSDTLEGLGGNDLFEGGPNADTMKGGDGRDTLDLSDRILRQSVILDNEPNDGDPSDVAGTDVSLTGADNAQGIEIVFGGSVKDTLIGDAAANRLEGRNGDDTLEGAGGADELIGGNGNDEILARAPEGGGPDPDAKIECGGGTDTVEADPEDVVGADCEDIDCGGCEQAPEDAPPGTPPESPQIAAIDPPGGANDADEGTGPGGSGSPPDPDGAGPQQAPAPLPPRVEVLSGGVVPLKANGRVPVRIICIYRANRCVGDLTLRTTSALKAKVRGKTRRIKKGAVIGKADLAPLRWGNSAPVNVKVSALFRQIVPRLKKPRTKVRATLLSRDVGGGPEARVTGDMTVAAKRARR